ncbi:RNA-binding protein [Pedobacter sp. SYSU D00535]|uniref:RNA recognition motif domain-containing protein n=1 Tax=Pedobacter sp. SYSU D00535 TaxID=2810308 RepID=UPI001A964D8B|nr:RNA-binding protein [Pedobacter sp. SYSU D00535]
MNIFVASLPYQLEEADLRETFEEFGTVASVKLILDKETGKKRGFGFVEMPDDEQAQKAISELNGAEMHGRAIAVSKAEEKRDNNRGRSFSRPDRSGGNFNRGGGGSGYSRNSGGSRDREDFRNGNRW